MKVGLVLDIRRAFPPSSIAILQSVDLQLRVRHRALELSLFVGFTELICFLAALWRHL